MDAKAVAVAGDGRRGRAGRDAGADQLRARQDDRQPAGGRRSRSRSGWSPWSGSRSSSGEGFGRLGEVGEPVLVLPDRRRCSGAVYVTTVLISVRTLGAGGVTAATIAGQLTLSRGARPARRARPGAARAHAGAGARRRAAGGGRLPGRAQLRFASRHSLTPGEYARAIRRTSDETSGRCTSSGAPARRSWSATCSWPRWAPSSPARCSR